MTPHFLPSNFLPFVSSPNLSCLPWSSLELKYDYVPSSTARLHPRIESYSASSSSSVVVVVWQDFLDAEAELERRKGQSFYFLGGMMRDETSSTPWGIWGRKVMDQGTDRFLLLLMVWVDVSDLLPTLVNFFPKKKEKGGKPRLKSKVRPNWKRNGCCSDIPFLIFFCSKKTKVVFSVVLWSLHWWFLTHSDISRSIPRFHMENAGERWWKGLWLFFFKSPSLKIDKVGNGKKFIVSFGEWSTEFLSIHFPFWRNSPNTAAPLHCWK